MSGSLTLDPSMFNFTNMGAASPGGELGAMPPMGGSNLFGQSTGLQFNGGPAQVGGGINFNGGLGSGLGLNVGTGQLAIGGLSALGNMWNAFQAQGLAKKQLQFSQGIANTNLNNQIKTFNSSLADRLNSRAVAMNRSPEEAQAQIAQRSLTR